MDKTKIFQEELLDHYKYPRNNKPIAEPDIFTGNVNPSCGDSVAFYICINDGKINLIGFQGQGCVISQATASKLTVFILHKDLPFIKKLTKDDILSLIGIPLGPTRLKCALLSLEALLEGLSRYAQ